MSADRTSDVPVREGTALLWSYARPHLRVLILGLVLSLGGTGVSLATPMVVKWVLDSLETGLDLAGPAAILLLLLVIGTAASLTQSLVLGRLAEHIVLDARRGLVRRFFRARLEQVQQYRTGELVTRVTSDTVLLREATTNSLIDLVNGFVALVGTIVLMAWLDVPLLVTTLLALSAIVVAFAVLVPQIAKADKRAQDAIGDLGATFEGGIRALRTVKSSRAEDREIGRVTAMAEASARQSIRSVWFSALTWAVAGGGMQLAIIVILGLGSVRVARGELLVSTLVAFLLYAFTIIGPISSLAGAVSTLQSGLAAAARIRETEDLDLEDTTRRPEDAPADLDAHEVSVGVPVLALRGVTAGYVGAAEPAICDVTLEIPRTGHVALVGLSGAGKTTVFSLLLRFIDPTCGHLELDGTPYGQLSIDDVRSRIAYVEQETPVIPGTVRENVLFRVRTGADADAGVAAPHPTHATPTEAEAEAEAWAALAAVRLDAKIRSLPDGLDAAVSETSLSGGERQRLAVARALVRRPGVLLLDEATAQLDGTTEAAMQQVIADASRDGAVVTIAHRLSTVLDADQIVVLEHGRIRDAGTHADLLARDELYREFIAALRIHTSL